MFYWTEVQFYHQKIKIFLDIDVIILAFNTLEMETYKFKCYGNDLKAQNGSEKVTWHHLYFPSCTLRRGDMPLGKSVDQYLLYSSI